MNSGTDLLRKLSSGVLPRGVGETPGALGRASVASSGFADLLSAAKDGTLASGRPVSPEKGSDPALTEAQLARMGAIADRAEASGASRVLVQMDGKWFKLDVGARQVSPAAEPRAGELTTGFDAVVREESDEARAARAAAPPTGDLLLKKLGVRR